MGVLREDHREVSGVLKEDHREVSETTRFGLHTVCGNTVKESAASFSGVGARGACHLSISGHLNNWLL